VPDNSCRELLDRANAKAGHVAAEARSDLRLATGVFCLGISASLISSTSAYTDAYEV
jgi:hypothetical protein